MSDTPEAIAEFKRLMTDPAARQAFVMLKERSGRGPQHLVLEASEMKIAKTGVTERTLDFYAAAFSRTPDTQGDIIAPGAFDVWLKAFYSRGDPLTLSYAHSAVINNTDAKAIIGYAPADPGHVWVDDYGLRIKGIVYTDTPEGQQVARLIDDGVLRAASLAYIATKEDVGKGGVRTIQQADVVEAGPCKYPANDQAVLLSLKKLLETEVGAEARIKELEARSAERIAALLTKAEEPAGEHTEPATETKAVDTSTWDGNRAMGECSTAAQYGSICAAEHNIGQPDERQHWAGPHHFLGKGPNEGGVRAGLGRWGTDFAGTQVGNISEAEWSRGLKHLQGHMREINPDYVAASDDLTKVALKHQAAPGQIQAAHDALVRAGAKCQRIEPTTSSAPPDPVTASLRRLRLMKAGLTR